MARATLVSSGGIGPAIDLRQQLGVYQITLLSLKRLNRSVKSELTNIETLYFGIMRDKFPGGRKSRCGRLRLPERQIKRAIQVL